MISAAILAGGDARRFDGRDKSQLRVGGVTILDRQLAALDGIVDEVLLVGYRGNAPVPAHVRRVSDRAPGHGPLGGLDAAMAATTAGAILVLACDMPHVTGAFLSHLIAQRAGADAVVPRTERGYHPLCAVYARACHGAAQHRLSQGQLRMVGLLEDVRIRVVEPDEMASYGDHRHLLANVNTLAELDAIESQLSH